MLKVYKSQYNHLKEIPLTKDINLESTWINLSNPTEEELNKVSNYTGISIDTLKVALDEDESSYMEIEDDYMFVIINVPIQNTEVGANEYKTLPLAIIITKDCIITIHSQSYLFIDQFIKNPASFSTGKRTRFFFQILNLNAVTYIKYLKIIIKRSNEIEKLLRSSTNNIEFFQLIDLQKSLTFFTTALQNNGVVLEKISRFKTFYQDYSSQEESLPYQSAIISKNKFLKIYEEDKELLEDVIIENKQAVDMVNTYSNILAGMLDALAGIVGNNLARIFKFLTLLAIIISVPGLVASMWGMNVQVPWEGDPIGFIFVPIIQLSVTFIIVGVLWVSGVFKR